MKGTKATVSQWKYRKLKYSELQEAWNLISISVTTYCNTHSVEGSILCSLCQEPDEEADFSIKNH